MKTDTPASLDPASILKTILASLTRQADRKRFITDLAEILHPAMQFSWLTLLPREQQQSMFVDCSRQKRTVNPLAPVWPDSLTAVIGRHIVDTQETVVVADCPDYFSQAVTPPVFQQSVASLIALPLCINGRVIATLHCGYEDPQENLYRMAAFLQGFCPAIAVCSGVILAVENTASESAARDAPPSIADDDFPVCRNARMRAVIRRLDAVAGLNVPVLLLGETGTGKSMFARYIHIRSQRKNARYVRVNCPSLTSTLFESEMFGHSKGAFTGATAGRVGRIGLADKGTLFLDEIAELAPDMQSKLLHVLENNRFERVGESSSTTVDIRIVSATNVDIRRALSEKILRRDLFHRIAVYTVHLPPLREHKDDIPALAARLSVQTSARMGVPDLTLDRAMLRPLLEYAWPGNVRELGNVISRLLIHQVTVGAPTPAAVEECLHCETGDGYIGRDTPESVPDPGSMPAAMKPLLPLAQVERDHILDALRRTGGVVAGARGAAALLNMPRSTFVHRMKKLGISRSSQTQNTLMHRQV
jgi:transcriptional regulator with GAF, ATPase, and Fis domain